MQKEVTKSFIESISEVFAKVLDCSVQSKKTEVDSDAPSVIGIIGLSGTAQGVIALQFTEEMATKAVSRMVSDHFDTLDESVADGVGELVNMIVGNAKVKLASHSLSMSLPSVLKGSLCRFKSHREIDWFDINFTSELGDFALAVAFKETATKEKETANVNTCSR